MTSISKAMRMGVSLYIGTALELAMAVSGHAQTAATPPPAAAPSQQTAEAAAAGSGDIVVTAQRRSERLQDVPLSVTVQSGAQLATAGVQNIRDLAFVAPGLTMQAQGAYVQPAIRGISTLVTGPGAENPIALYVDGVYDGSQAGASLDLPDIERVEVSKGPQGTLFGRNATGGAIQIFTKGPDFSTSGDMSATAGWYTGAGTSRSSYDLGFKGFLTAPIVDDKIAASLSFSYRHVDGYGTNLAADAAPASVRSNYDSDRTYYLKSYSLRGKLLFKLSDDVSLLLTGYYSNRNTDVGEIGTVVNGLTVASLYPGSIYGTKPWQEAYDDGNPYSKIIDYGGNAKLTVNTDIGTFTSITSYAVDKYFELVDVDASYSPQCLQTPNFACITYHDDQPNKNFLEDFLFSSKKFGIIRFSAGANYYHSNGQIPSTVNDFSDGAGPGDPGYVAPPLFAANTIVKTIAVGVFAQADLNITDQLILTGGVRYSDDKKKGYVSFFGSPYTNFTNPNWHAVTPHASLRYELSSHSNVYASYSEGFKSGSIPTLSFNAPVNPETLNAYEIGFKTASHGFRFNMAGFRYDYNNLQVQSFTGTVIVPQNAASAQITGFEAEGGASLTSELSVHGGLTWLPEAKYVSFPSAAGYAGPITIAGLTAIVGNVSGHRLIRAPKLNATAGFTYTKDLSGGKLEFSPNLIYNSKYLPYEPFGIIVQKAYARVGFDLTYTPTNSPLKYSLWGHNLTNTASIGASTVAAGAARVAYEEPQEFGVTIGYKF